MRLLDILAYFLDVGYVFVFFWILQTFLPLRKSWAMRIPAFFVCNLLACVIVYSHDLDALLGAMLGFVAYVTVFHRGRWMEKLTAVLVFDMLPL